MVQVTTILTRAETVVNSPPAFWKANCSVMKKVLLPVLQIEKQACLMWLTRGASSWTRSAKRHWKGKACDVSVGGRFCPCLAITYLQFGRHVVHLYRIEQHGNLRTEAGCVLHGDSSLAYLLDIHTESPTVRMKVPKDRFWPIVCIGSTLSLTRMDRKEWPRRHKE